MKKFTQIALLLMGMVVAFAGCDAAKEAASDATKKVGEMADIDLGGLKMSELKEKFAGITEGFTEASEDETKVDGLKTKVEELTGTLDEVKTDELGATQKTAVGGAMSAFAKAVEGAMAGAPEAIKTKLEPVVTPLMEKLKSFGS